MVTVYLQFHVKSVLNNSTANSQPKKALNPEIKKKALYTLVLEIRTHRFQISYTLT